MTVYDKIIKASNFYYNQGLARASVRDLSGAVESLSKSLRYNKMNTQARNLLGLVYYEMGETVSALSEWVISRNLQSSDNEAEQYLNQIQKNGAKLDTLNQTIKKYNQALMYCKQGSSDLAILQLKKVISLNPKLVKGHQLLALLYLQEGKYDLAKKSLRQAARIDAGNTMTLSYLKEINQVFRDEPAKPTKKSNKKERMIEYRSGNETIIQPVNVKDHSALSTIINIFIGVVIGACITAFLIVPGIKYAAQNDAKAAEKEANDTIATKSQAIRSLEDQIEELQGKITDRETATEETEKKIAVYDQLLKAFKLYADNDITGAGDALAEIDKKELSKTAKSIYDQISDTVDEQYIQAAYDTGERAYKQKDYEEAADSLQKVVDQDEKYNNGYALYYLAQSYRNLGENEKAAVYYQKMVEEFPGTERASTSQKYLNQME